MPRIPEDVIERLKKEVSLERLAEAGASSCSGMGRI